MTAQALNKAPVFSLHKKPGKAPMKVDVTLTPKVQYIQYKIPDSPFDESIYKLLPYEFKAAQKAKTYVSVYANETRYA